MIVLKKDFIAKQQTMFIKNPIYVSYTGLSDFLKCPRSYYLKSIYRDPKQNFRLQIINPYLVLGSTVHDTIKWFLEMEGQVTRDQLEKKFRNLWLKFRGKRGGFLSDEDEAFFGKRGLKMLVNFYKNAAILRRTMPFLSFPKYNLTENLILIGNMDFVGLLDDGTLQVIDFKTGANDEESTLQLYIYAILSESNYGKPISRASFWYLDRDDEPRSIVLDSLDGQIEWLKQKGLELKKAIEKNVWICIKEKDGLCRDCRDYQALLDGKGEFLFSDLKYKKEK